MADSLLSDGGIPVAAIAVGVVLFSGRGRRLTTAWVMGLSMFVVGGYWYVRAAIKTGGNPIPQVRRLQVFVGSSGGGLLVFGRRLMAAVAALRTRSRLPKK